MKKHFPTFEDKNYLHAFHFPKHPATSPLLMSNAENFYWEFVTPHRVAISLYPCQWQNSDVDLILQGFWTKSSWGFPKGKVNEEEPPHICAARYTAHHCLTYICFLFYFLVVLGTASVADPDSHGSASFWEVGSGSALKWKAGSGFGSECKCKAGSRSVSASKGKTRIRISIIVMRFPTAMGAPWICGCPPMEPWRLSLEPYEKSLDPHQTEKSDPDQHRREKPDSDPRIRNTGYSQYHNFICLSGFFITFWGYLELFEYRLVYLLYLAVSGN